VRLATKKKLKKNGKHYNNGILMLGCMQNKTHNKMASKLEAEAGALCSHQVYSSTTYSG
jgi:hypothetical protein